MNSTHRTFTFSLKAKTLGLVILTMFVTIGLLTWTHLASQRAILGQIAREHSELLAQTVQHRIADLMHSGQHAEIDDYLATIGKQHDLRRLIIFDPEGRILRSARHEEMGVRLDREETRHLIAHTNRAPHPDEGESVFSSIIAIPNRSDCHGCHAPQQQLLGYLNVDFSLDYLTHLQNQGRQVTLATSLGLLLLAITLISLFFFVFVEQPVRRLLTAMGHLEQGRFDQARTHIDSSTEMQLLSDKFSSMANRLHGLINSKVEQETLLARQQARIAHAEELHTLNVTLEERLKEIEYLNVTLEERIEEIEDANFRIADLAAELESKNTSLLATVERLSALSSMGLAINSTLELERLFDLLLRRSLETLQGEIAYLLLLNEENHDLTIGRVSANIPFQQFPTGSIPLREGGVSHWVVTTGEPLLISDMNENSRFNRSSLLGFERRTVLCAPLSIKGKVIGTLTVANRRDGTPYSQQDLELVSAIAAQASVAISNARLYEEQEKTYLATVQALVSAIEASDPYTRGHSERVTRIALTVAQQMGLDAATLIRLEQAAILHDIGKIGIDPALLRKAELLDAEEMRLMQHHPVIGRSILSPVHFLGQVRDIISQHHERVDGTGYPEGLAGEQICLEARILAVADAYDAMTSHRPYRPAQTHAHAVTEIRTHSGSQFDPEVVAAFIECCERQQIAA